MIIPTDQSIARIEAQDGIKYRLQPGEEQDRILTIINESAEHTVIWDDRESNVKIVKESRDIPRLTAKEFIWHQDTWWCKDDWYRKMCGEKL